MAAKRIKRKKYFISARFQLKYIAYMLFILYVGAVIAGYTVYYTTWITLGEKLANVYPRGRLIYIFQASNMSLILRLLLITPLFMIIGVFLSHRIVGPVYRIEQYLESLMGGDYSQPLSLRKKDEFKGLAEKITRLRDKLLDERETRNQEIDDLVRFVDSRELDEKTSNEIKSRLKVL